MTPTNHEHDRFHAEHGHGDHDGLHNEDVAHEHSDINIRAVLMFTGGLAVVTALILVAMYVLFNVFEHQAAQNDPVRSPLAVPAGQQPPQPQLLPLLRLETETTSEPLNLERIRAEEAQVLGAYGWVNEKAGTARLPIDEAKKRLLHNGLPVRPEGPVDPWVGTNASARGESSSGRLPGAKPAAEPAPQPEPPAAAQPPAPHKGGHQ